ncbi:hypothetical protein SDC9_159351 [bioreactor metagenome]|uniref:Uncharacterized protein n=1 Tax=bioreactor metagenome TaxID=1076179 RepID=A0A645FCI8_9ZZZZ
MYLVDEKDIVFVQVGEQRGEIAGLFYRGAGGYADIDAHLRRNYPGQSRLAEPRRAVEQNVIERLCALFCRRYEYRQVFLCFLLPDILRKRVRTKRYFVGGVLAEQSFCDYRLIVQLVSVIYTQTCFASLIFILSYF